MEPYDTIYRCFIGFVVGYVWANFRFFRKSVNKIELLLEQIAEQTKYDKE